MAPISVCASEDHTQEQEKDVLAPNVLWCQWTEVIGRSGVVQSCIRTEMGLVMDQIKKKTNQSFSTHKCKKNPKPEFGDGLS